MPHKPFQRGLTNTPPPYYVRTGFPSLTPAYGLGSYGRNAGALLISGSRTTIGNQGRIFSWYQARGLGEQYKAYLLRSLGTRFVYKNTWSILGV